MSRQTQAAFERDMAALQGISVPELRAWLDQMGMRIVPCEDHGEHDAECPGWQLSSGEE